MSGRDEHKPDRGTAVDAWIDLARKSSDPADVRRAEMLCASHRDARITTTLMDDFDRARAPREGDAGAIERALAGALSARAATRDRRASGDRWKAASSDGPRTASAVATPGPQPAIHVVRRPAPPPKPMGWIAVAAAAVVGIAIGAGAAIGGGVIVASIERERAVAGEHDAPAAIVSARPDPEDAAPAAPEVSPFAAARELLDRPVSSHRAARWLITARDALDEDDPELAERVLRRVIRRWPRSLEAGTARLALAEIALATDRPREAIRLLDRWLRGHRHDPRAGEIEERLAELRGERY